MARLSRKTTAQILDNVRDHYGYSDTWLPFNNERACRCEGCVDYRARIRRALKRCARKGVVKLKRARRG